MKKKAFAAIAKKLREDGSTYLSVLEQTVEEYTAKTSKSQTILNTPEISPIASTDLISSVEASTEEGSKLLKNVATRFLEADTSPVKVIKSATETRWFGCYITGEIKSRMVRILLNRLMAGTKPIRHRVASGLLYGGLATLLIVLLMWIESRM